MSKKPESSAVPSGTTAPKQATVAVMRSRPAWRRMDPLDGTPTQQESRFSNHIHRRVPGDAETSRIRRGRHLACLRQHRLGDAARLWLLLGLRLQHLLGDGVRFQEASEAVAFLAGHAMADRWHNDAMHKAAAEEGRDAEEGGDAIQLTVAT